MMTPKEAMLRFVDAVISGDENTDKLAFTEYTELKAREFMGTSTPAGASLHEGVSPLVRFTGTDPVIVGVRKDADSDYSEVGKVIYEDDNNGSEDMVFVKNDNSRVKLGKKNTKELMSFIEQNYLTGTK